MCFPALTMLLHQSLTPREKVVDYQVWMLTRHYTFTQRFAQDRANNKQMCSMALRKTAETALRMTFCRMPKLCRIILLPALLLRSSRKEHMSRHQEIRAHSL